MSANKKNNIHSSRFNTAFHDDRVMDSMLAKMLQSESDQQQFLDRCMEGIAKIDTSEELVILGENVHDDASAELRNQASAIQLMGIAAVLLVGCFMYSMFLALATPERQYAATRHLDAPVDSGTASMLEVASNCTLQPNGGVGEHLVGEVAPVTMSEQEWIDLESAIATYELRENLNQPKDPSEAISLNEIESMFAEDSIPKRYFNVKIKLNGQGRGPLLVNNCVIAKNLESFESKIILSKFVPELAQRISLFGPRLGQVFGNISLETSQGNIIQPFDTIGEFKNATTAICKSLEEMGGNDGDENFKARVALRHLAKKTNDLFQGWAQDSIQIGFADTPRYRDPAERFARVINLKDFHIFAKTGTFLVKPRELYLPETSIQHLDASLLRQQLASGTQELSLFKNVREFELFKAAILATASLDPFDSKARDEPIEQLVDNRTDLVGLPLVMGRDCHMEEKRANSMDLVSRELGPTMALSFANRPGTNLDVITKRKAVTFANVLPGYNGDSQKILTVDQMVQHEVPTLKLDFLAKLGSERNQVNANLLACYAKYDLDEGIRMAATRSLANYDPAAYRKQLLKGFSYPWEIVAQHSAESLVRLNDIDAVPELVELLRAPSPNSPYKNKQGKYVRRQLVAVNHMKNCMLCHAPSYSSRDRGRAIVPEWNRPVPPSYYHPGSSPSRLVARADITYLRQDFSVMQPVEKHNHWPKNQRFDYVVREAPVAGEDAGRSRQVATQSYRDAIVFALQKLTDRMPERNDYNTWRKIADEIKSMSP